MVYILKSSVSLNFKKHTRNTILQELQFCVILVRLNDDIVLDIQNIVDFYEFMILLIVIKFFVVEGVNYTSSILTFQTIKNSFEIVIRNEELEFLLIVTLNDKIFQMLEVDAHYIAKPKPIIHLQ